MSALWYLLRRINGNSISAVHTLSSLEVNPDHARQREVVTTEYEVNQAGSHQNILTQRQKEGGDRKRNKRFTNARECCASNAFNLIYPSLPTLFRVIRGTDEPFLIVNKAKE